jgi:hypothetical protein
MKDTMIGNSFNAPGDYRIEVSGWGADNSFFVERADLVWTAAGEKQICLLHELPEGAVLFARSISNETSNASVPVAFRARTVIPTESKDRYQIDLVRMHPRKPSLKQAKESSGRQIASNIQEAKRSCKTNESGMELEHEEILR